MATLALRLAGPMQSWGDSSRFLQRRTSDAPTKSGVLGLLGAALGLRRTDPLESLLSLSFGVRFDSPGSVMRDFQTARSLDGKDAMPLTHRYYLADAAFLAVVEGELEVIENLQAALRAPAFPLYLGRRSCPPVMPLALEASPASLYEVLTTHTWIAPARVQNASGGGVAKLQVVVDSSAVPPDVLARSAVQAARDVPVSFDPQLRVYEWRKVSRFWTDVGATRGATSDPGLHDPFSLTEA